MRTHVLAALFHLALVVPLRAQARAYSLTDVGGDLPSPLFADAALSDTGLVVAWTQDAAGHSFGFRWSPGTRGAPSSIARFDPPPGVAWLDHNTIGVNSSGAVIGLFGDVAGGFQFTRGYRWKDGASIELLAPSGFRAIPWAINDAGYVVGTSGARFFGVPAAVMWDPAGVASVVDGLDVATDINARGAICGFRYEGTFPGVTHGYLRAGGALVPLGSLDPTGRGDVVPLALDESGRVVGFSKVRGTMHAFLWTAATGMRELAAPPGTATDMEAIDISDDGWVVGGTVLWAPDGSVHDLGALLADQGLGTRWSGLFSVLHVNSSGQIAGVALTLTGELRPVLLTPADLRAGAPVSGTAGASSTLSVSGARPGKPVFLLGDFDDGLDQGFTRLPGRLSLGLGLATPYFVSSARADAAGTSAHAWLAPPALGGLAVRLQALQPISNALSNVVHTTL